MPAPLTRRRLLQGAAIGGIELASAHWFTAQQPAPSARLNVPEAVRPRVLQQAKAAMVTPVVPLTEVKSPFDDPHTFSSELEPASDARVAGGTKLPFREQARALRATSTTVACLAAAYLLSKEVAYAQQAGKHLRAWFVDPETRMLPHGRQAGRTSSSSEAGSPAGVVDLVPLAEIARATSFLVDSEALQPDEFAAMNKWFAELGTWLDTDRTAGLARDTKDHRASSWLLIQSAIARSQRDDKLLEACRKRFRAPTLRNQINVDGRFPQEIATPDPFRNTLFNFDLLCGACQLLASPFDLLWDFELQDGPGMRAVAAFVYPAIADPTKWPYVADAAYFRNLPGPRPGLLFAGRAYNRPEYVELWRSLDPLEIPEEIGASFPIRQPLLWTARAAHGL